MTNSDKTKIWLYWENMPGKHLPVYLQLCYEIICDKCKSCDIFLVTNQNLSNYLPNINIDLDKIRLKESDAVALALKADFIRAALLQKFGGIWLDMDCIVLKDLGPIVHNILNKYDFYGMFKKKGFVVNNIMASRKEGVIITEYFETITNHIVRKISNNEPFTWIEIGASMLTPIIDKYKNITYLEDEHSFHPIDSSEFALFWQNSHNIRMKNFVNDETIVFMLYNNLFNDEEKSYSRRQILNSNCLIGQLMRHCLPQHTLSVFNNNTELPLCKQDVDFIIVVNIETTSHFHSIRSIRNIFGNTVNIYVAIKTNANTHHKETLNKYQCNIFEFENDINLNEIYNKLIQLSNSSYICICDEDCIIDTDFDIFKSISLLETRKDIDILSGIVQIFENDNIDNTNNVYPIEENSYLSWNKNQSKYFFPCQFIETPKEFVDEFYYIHRTHTLGSVSLLRREIYNKVKINWINLKHISCFIGILSNEENTDFSIYRTNLLLAKKTIEKKDDNNTIKSNLLQINNIIKQKNINEYIFVGKMTII